MWLGISLLFSKWLTSIPGHELIACKLSPLIWSGNFLLRHIPLPGVGVGGLLMSFLLDVVSLSVFMSVQYSFNHSRFIRYLILDRTRPSLCTLQKSMWVFIFPFKMIFTIIWSNSKKTLGFIRIASIVQILLHENFHLDFVESSDLASLYVSSLFPGIFYIPQ